MPWKSTLFMSKWLTLWKKLLSVKMAQWESTQARGKWFQSLESTCKLACMGSGWNVSTVTDGTKAFLRLPACKFPQPPVPENTRPGLLRGKVHCLTSPGTISHPQHWAEWTPLFKGCLEIVHLRKIQFHSPRKKQYTYECAGLMQRKNKI